jgi:DNA gyrase inhibitor GyrI
MAEHAPASAALATPSGDITVGEIAALKANVAKLEVEVDELRTLVGRLYAELGIAAK